MLLFDLESNGFLDVANVVHCLVTHDPCETTFPRHNDVGTKQPIDAGLEKLNATDMVVGHNILKYDLPVLEKVRGFKLKPHIKVLDTLILARLAYPELGEIDDKLIRACKLPPKHRGAHKLEAWGYRLGVLKDEYEGDYAAWSIDMEDYCAQDVNVNAALLTYLLKSKVSEEALELEHAVTRIIARQEQSGFTFDETAAKELLVVLSKERLELEEDLKKRFAPWYARAGKEFVPKKDHKAHCYTQGAPLTKVQRISFNPGSRQHIARVLIKVFGWKPTAFTPTGEPEISEESLKAVRHPEAKTLLRYLMIQKRIGQLAEGKQAWLNFVKNGKIHGSVNVGGAVTGRMTHSNPNVSQAPAVRSIYGAEMRALFSARPGWALVGCDADGLELRVMAHFMALFDGGTYVKTVLEGDKKKGTDVHSVNARALQLEPTKVYWDNVTGRDIAKTWFYAFIYGAGDEKLGMIISNQRNKTANIRIGRNARTQFLANLPSMKKLLEAIKASAKARKWLKGLDGRKLTVRSEHAAPNTLFQSAGAIVMKKAVVILDNELQTKGLKPNDDYEFCGNFHDEWQIESRPELAQQIGELAVEAIRAAGRWFKFRCPLDGQYVVGRTWSDTH